MKITSRPTFVLLLASTMAAWAQQGPIMAVTANIGSPVAVIADGEGNLYFSTDYNTLGDFDDCRVFRVYRGGVLSVVAGTAVAGYSGDGGPAVNAQLNYPMGLAFDGAGNLYIADWGNYRVRMVTPAGLITTVAGNGTEGYSGDGGTATKAEFSGPQAVMFDRTGNLYVGDVEFNGGYSAGNPRTAWGWVRKISPNGIISTLAGGGWCYPGGVQTCTGSIPAIGSSAAAIPLSWVRGLAVDSASNVYISNYKYNYLVSYVGDYVFVVSPDGLFVADFPGFNDPVGVAFDAAGNLYVADAVSSRVRKITAAGIVTTVAGTGVQGHSGDGDLATQAELNQPTGIAFDNGGNLYIADWGNQRIRKVSSGSGIISTVAGGGLASVPSAGPPVISSVVSGASFQPGIVSNAWVTIKGTKLSSTTDTWANAILNGKLPTNLDGVGVNISGLPAYIYYVSPTQINVVAPNLPLGTAGLTNTVSVTVAAPSGTSNIFTMTESAVSATVQPAFFLWPGSYAVATRQDFSWAVKNGIFPGTTTVPAKPGDVVILWGTGFGPTNPAAPIGVLIPSDTIYRTASPVTISLGDTTALVYSVALAPVYAGLYQVAIQIPPSLANGDYPVIATIDGAQSPAGVLITVQK